MKLTKDGILRIHFRDLPDDKGRLRCNFRCSYCIQVGNKVVEYPFTEKHFQQTKSIWDALSSIEDEILVRINFNGETFIDEWAKKCSFYINKIPNVKICEFITNNSVDPKTYLSELDLSKTTFNCSFHPEFISTKQFIENAALLRKSGCNVIANICAAPQFIKRIPEFRKIFDQHNIPLILQGFITLGNDYMGKKYPDSYTNEERHRLTKLFYTNEEYEYFVKLKKTTGANCYAGVDMINVFLDGNVRRCFTGSIGSVEDLVSGRIKLKSSPYPCHDNNCPCYPHFIHLEQVRAKYPLSASFVDYYDLKDIKTKNNKTFIIRCGDFCKKIESKLYCFRLKTETTLYNLAHDNKVKNKKYKCLYSSPVGKDGKEFLAKIIQKFGYDDFDYLIFVYDDTEFKEKIFKHCTFVYEKNLKWYFMKKYVTPEYCRKYDYIFVWADDIDIRDFSHKNFLMIMQRNNLQMAQPALADDSYHDVPITIQNKSYRFGRFTDYVESMIPVFTRAAWSKYWDMLESDYNFWGWGYPRLAKSYCRYSNMGIVDCEIVRHTRETRSKFGTAPQECEKFLRKNKKFRITRWISYGSLK